VLKPSVEVQLVVSRALPLPDLESFDYAAPQTLPLDDIVVVLGDSMPEPLGPGDWYLGVVNLGGGTARYDVLAREFDQAGTNVSLVEFDFVDGELCMTWTNTLPGVRYYVQGTETLTPIAWVAVSPAITTTSNALTFCIPLTSPYKYFQLAEGEPSGAERARITSASSTVDGFLIEWVAPANLNFMMEWNPDLTPGNWQAFTDVVTSATTQYEFLDDGSQGGGAGTNRFYRVLQVP
jgi:hypothetical protein